MTITEKYLKCLEELQNNPNVELGKYSEQNYYSVEASSERFMERRKKKNSPRRISLYLKKILSIIIFVP